jgi:hypothetical protein
MNPSLDATLRSAYRVLRTYRAGTRSAPLPARATRSALRHRRWGRETRCRARRARLASWAPPKRLGGGRRPAVRTPHRPFPALVRRRALAPGQPDALDQLDRPRYNCYELATVLASPRGTPMTLRRASGGFERRPLRSILTRAPPNGALGCRHVGRLEILRRDDYVEGTVLPAAATR